MSAPGPMGAHMGFPRLISESWRTTSVMHPTCAQSSTESLYQEIVMSKEKPKRKAQKSLKERRKEKRERRDE
jgi:hypothetical protein